MTYAYGYYDLSATNRFKHSMSSGACDASKCKVWTPLERRQHQTTRKPKHLRVSLEFNEDLGSLRPEAG